MAVVIGDPHSLYCALTDKEKNILTDIQPESLWLPRSIYFHSSGL